ncbi:antibiotic biosynthesis monooxygenase family protein [Brevibacterium oceani]|jgi:heme-degrading monooxygenase HmoA|uniref:antibiotic biosynthesis monooxygenase family protein n=1 Tax=Brevibacterium oceani TaxID=358099 RepID=UPI001B334597|nr:antibiotic biosynthesis monooxygenase [Brevibacterium oceani]
MSVVAINTLTVPEPARAELEKRFADRKHSVDGAPGFEGFQLLRPVAGGDKYFVYTQWATKEDFENWKQGRKSSHESTGKEPVSSAAELLEFEVVDLGE